MAMIYERILMFVVLCALGITFKPDVDAEPIVIAQPSKIESGLTDFLNVNCTFTSNTSADVDDLISITLSRAGQSGVGFTDIGTINEFADQKVDILTAETVTATGHLGQTGNSFLHLHWDQPDNVQSGVYKCSAHGLNSLGQNIVFVNTTQVSSDEAGLVDKITETDDLIVDIAKNMEKLEDALTNFTSAFDIQVTTIEQLKALTNITVSVQQRLTAFEQKSSMNNFWLQNTFSIDLVHWMEYENRVYYKSNVAFRNINQSIATCKSYGGYLAVINDEDEFNAIMEKHDHVQYEVMYFDGRYDAIKSQWISNYNDEPLPYENWSADRPSKIDSGDCLAIYIDLNSTPPTYNMVNATCSLSSEEHRAYRFDYLCEFERPN